MKYGESAFDILYLLFAVLSGCVLLIKAKNRAEKLTGAAALTLGVGDAFHLVPRVLNYFSGADFTSALGIGKLVTSVTMTFFYLILYYIWLERFEEKNGPGLKLSVWLLSAVRIILCLFPQNGWISNSSVLEWSIARNVPFVILGALICFLFFKTRKKDAVWKPVWAYILLSFLFYVPVAAGAGFVPILGMLMLPKTVCYILMIAVFLRSALQGRTEPAQPGKT